MTDSRFNVPFARSSLASVSDAVHGGIDVRDAPGCGTNDVIARLLHSPMVTRLRRIEQLGFVSQQYIAADHSRYAHAVGTMHMMRLMLEHIRDHGGPPLNDVSDLQKAFPDAFFASKSPERDVAIVSQHMLVAALLQDVGELPYNMASMHVCTPHDNLRASVDDWLGLQRTWAWTHKEVFTVGSLREHWDDAGAPEGIDHKLLIFLITGASKDNLGRFKAWRHMLDGVVDADRLDYVFRDGHHTVGRLGGPLSVIESLIGYEDAGPVFSNPGPVSQFLASRAHLYAAVYLSPQNRFRMIVLIHLLKDIAVHASLATLVFGPSSDRLMVKDFLRLDDVSLSERLRTLAKNEDYSRQLDSKAQVALRVFVEGEPRYAPYWLSAPAESPSAPQPLKLPPELFWDTFTDVGGPIYVRDSIRVQSAQFKYLNRAGQLADYPTIPLEMCGGPFDLIARPKFLMLPASDSEEFIPVTAPQDTTLRPMPHCVLLFEPEGAAAGSGFWPDYHAAIRDGRLFGHVMTEDPLTPHSMPPTTWDKVDFEGPRIFISYATPDRSVVLKLIDSLYRRRRQYCALIGKAQNMGVPPTENVDAHLARAQAVILVVSDAYRLAYSDPKRHVRREVDYMTQNLGRLTLLPVAADPFNTLYDALPWSGLGWPVDPPWMGEKDLRELPTPDVDQVVAAVLDYIDNNRKQS